MSFLEYRDIINFDYPYMENRSTEDIYICLKDPPLLTVVMGAKCSDGFVLIADRKMTRSNGEVCFMDKIVGDVEHFLIGYIGDTEMFDIFRRYTMRAVMIEGDTANRYMLENLLSKVSKSIKRFNELDCGPCKVLMANHRGDKSVLYHFAATGIWDEIANYKAIGTGSTIADNICCGLEHNKITMKDFTRHAYLAIDYMDLYCPGLGVGIEPKGVPDIKYLAYDKVWEEKASEEDVKGYKKYSAEKLEGLRQSFDTILKE
jgi:20S proteasome alpha/beta subunit